MKYVKLDLTFGDKLKLLFFGIISEDKMPVTEVVREVYVDRIVEKNVPVTTPDGIKKTINTTEDEKFQVPFFDLNTEEVKSNF